MEIPDLAAGDFENLTITSQLQVIRRTANGRAVSLDRLELGGYLAALYAARHAEVERMVLMARHLGLRAAGRPRWARKDWLHGAGRVASEMYHYGRESVQCRCATSSSRTDGL